MDTATQEPVLARRLAYSMVSAWLPQEAAPWMREGLAEFMRALWIERTEGREPSLMTLAADADLLAQQEAFAGGGTGQPLELCAAAPCARTKAAYVFEMLRQIAGENTLKQAIAAWRVRAMQDPRKATAGALQALLEQISGKKLDWFFADWVQADPGLPDLRILAVAPRRMERGTASAVPAQRQVIGGPIGPEPVPQPGDPESQRPAERSRASGLPPAAGSWLVAVEVQNDGGAAVEVPVSVRAGNLVNTLPLRVPAHGRATVRVPFEAQPEEVWVNDGSVPEMRTSTHRRSIGAAPAP
jgi:hypothetical protein